MEADAACSVMCKGLRCGHDALAIHRSFVAFTARRSNSWTWTKIYPDWCTAIGCRHWKVVAKLAPGCDQRPKRGGGTVLRCSEAVSRCTVLRCNITIPLEKLLAAVREVEEYTRQPRQAQRRQ